MRHNENGRNALADDLDPVDARILDILQHDAGMSVADVAERVGLSASPCWRRIKRLEETGFIRKRVTLLDATRLGLDFEVYAIVKLSLPSTGKLEVFAPHHLGPARLRPVPAREAAGAGHRFGLREPHRHPRREKRHRPAAGHHHPARRLSDITDPPGWRCRPGVR